MSFIIRHCGLDLHRKTLSWPVAEAGMREASSHNPPPQESSSQAHIAPCPRCFLPVDTSQQQRGGECELHGRSIHTSCIAKMGSSSCLFCRPDLKPLGRLAVMKLTCERMVEVGDDVALQSKGQAAMLAMAKLGPHEVKMLEECRGLSIAMANVNRAQPSTMVRDGMELICVVCQVPYQGLDAPGFMAACHAVTREVRKTFTQGDVPPTGAGAGSAAGAVMPFDPMLRNVVMSACVALAGLSVSLAITLTDLKLVDVLVKQLQPDGDPQAQVEAIAILTSLSAHKTVAPRLVLSKVHSAALRLLPLPPGPLAPPPIITSNSPRSASEPRQRRGPKMCYILSLLADLCEHGAPHDEMEQEGALCARVKNLLQESLEDNEVSAQCCRVIVAVAAGSDSCAEALGVQGVCESLTALLGRPSLPRDTLVNVLDGIYWMCQAVDSKNKDRFGTYETAQKVVKGFVSLCSTMRAAADPVLLCCFLRAMRGLCTHHRANADALGQYAVLHIKELGRTSKDDLDLVSECGAALSALNGALSSRPSSLVEPNRSQNTPRAPDQTDQVSEAGRSSDGSNKSDGNMSIAEEEEEAEDEELVYSRQFKKSSLPCLVRGNTHKGLEAVGDAPKRSSSMTGFRSTSNAATAIAKMKAKRIQTLEALSKANLALPTGSRGSLSSGGPSAASEASNPSSLPARLTPAGPSRPSDGSATGGGAIGTLQRHPSLSPISMRKSIASGPALPTLDTASVLGAYPSGLGTSRNTGRGPSTSRR